MSERLARLAPEEFDDEQRALHAELTGGPRAGSARLFPLADPHGRLLGPFDAMLRNPAIGQPLQALGARLRYGGQLPDRVRELVILVVAGHWDNSFEAGAHERVGRAAGLTDDELRAARSGAADGFPDPLEAAAVRVADAVLRRGDLSDAEYAELAGVLPAPLLFEVVCLIGYYTTLAWTMRAFRADHPLPE
ncbi:MAG TPA: carboxymuconolactone decarboxylase family protein [Micromonosporaceae bacterium]|nr:carboxymuconolactone decarboxylase family protein [Micromonosporaceae bacterium]